MKILSIDIGIKNFSFCLFEIILTTENTNTENTNTENTNTENISVIKWDNIDLSKQTENKCIMVDNNIVCTKPVKFFKNCDFFCLKHSKKQPFLRPTTELKHSYINKQKLQSLIEIADKYNIIYDHPPKKTNINNLLNEFILTHCFNSIEKINSSKIDLVTIGRNIQIRFDDILCEHLTTIDSIIIENQIGPIANKMKTIQGMISQYFIMRNHNIKIEFISASNKLKDFLPKETDGKMDYKQRKKLRIKTCLNFVNTDERFKEWDTFVNKHSKKDDLSDCFLQGLWYIKHKI